MVTTSRQQASARSRAEEEFLAAQKKSKAVVKEKERLHDEKSQHVAGLKAKRLAKEAAERDAAAAAPAKPAKSARKSTGKTADKEPAHKNPAQKLPQFHRF
ncbi:MAG TPA: hypothetical protein DCG48_11465 [Rhodospirillaceae bacterium]|nr:hypothetical protein [Rhodospirillaceae bacterium]